jgi:transposase-like protein
VQEADVQGVSTRPVDVQAMGMSGISKGQVSRRYGEILDKVKAFLGRPTESDWPYLWTNASYAKVRQQGRIVSVAVIVAIGAAFPRKLARRGLRGVKLVVSDAHGGIKAAVSKVLDATWRRHRVHFMRDVMAQVGKSGRRVVSAFITTAVAYARALWRKAPINLDPGYPNLLAFSTRLKLTCSPI